MFLYLQGVFKRRMAIASIPFMLLALAIFAGCESKVAPTTPDPVRVQLVWKHQSQFAGFYVADQRGEYQKEGLKVELTPRSEPGIDVFEKVSQGEADFGVGHGVGLITSRDKGLPITAFACIYRHYALVFITLKNSRIEKPEDFPGHTIRTLTPGGSAVAFNAMMTKMGLDTKSIQQVDIGYDFQRFLAGEVDIWPGYVTDEVLKARRKGVAVNRILPSDYGVHLYGDTLFTTEAIIQNKPDLVLRFLRASLRGWQWAIENADKAGPMALAYAPELDAQHEIDVMAASIPLIHPGKEPIGWMRSEVWTSTLQILKEQNIIKGPVDLDKVYTNSFLEKIYTKDQK